MERKDDSMIRRKVQGLESEPVVLDRERLWDSISFPASRREPRSLIYYAAASVAVAWALVFLFQELSRRDQLQVRLLELELSIQSEITRVSLNAAITSPAEVPCEMPETIDIVVPPKRMIIRQASVNPPGPNESSAAVQEAPPTEVGEISVAQVTAPPQPALVAAQPPAKPRVVLGTALPDNTSSAGKQRLRLGLFREEEHPTTSTPLVTLAGVNNQ